MDRSTWPLISWNFG